tara:strand:- start:218 stop:1177 length:960 start_codon:yes stop_codon:yes gene_type:complete
LKSNNLKIWTLTDGSQGMISQVLGLAQELGKDIYQINTDIRFPWSFLQPGIIPFFKWSFKNSIDDMNKPNVVISCGRKSVYLSIYLKKIYKDIINIHIQNPKTSFKYFDYIVAPNHDGIKGINIINSLGALHKFSTEIIDRTDPKFNISTEKLVTCIIGGQNQHYYFNSKEVIDLCLKIKNLKKNNPLINILVLTSRRTNESSKKILLKELSSIATVWIGEGKNPYLFALKYSSNFIVTSDSTSMISESTISGRPIYIYKLPFKRISKRMEKFHNEFNNLKITRDFSNNIILSDWVYKPINESKRIAGIIKERIIQEHR